MPNRNPLTVLTHDDNRSVPRWFVPLFVCVALLSFCALAGGWWWNYAQAVTPGFTVANHPQGGWVVTALADASANASTDAAARAAPGIRVGTRFTHIQPGAHAAPVPLQPQWLQGDMLRFQSTADLREALRGEGLLFHAGNHAVLLSPDTPGSVRHRVELRPLHWNEVGLNYISFVVASFFVLSMGLLVLWIEPKDRCSHVATAGAYVFAIACVVGSSALPRHWVTDPEILHTRLGAYSLLMRTYALLTIQLLWMCPYAWRTGLAGRLSRALWSPGMCFWRGRRQMGRADGADGADGRKGLSGHQGLKGLDAPNANAEAGSSRWWHTLGAGIPAVAAVLLYGSWWVEYEQMLHTLTGTRTVLYATVSVSILTGLSYQLWTAWHQNGDSPYQTIVNRIVLQWVAVGVVMNLVLSMYLRLSPSYGNASVRGAFQLFLRPEAEVMTAMMLVKIVISTLVLRRHLYRIQTPWWHTRGAAITFCGYVAWLWFLRSVQPSWLTAANIVMFFTAAIAFYLIARLLYLSRRIAGEGAVFSHATAGLLHMAGNHATPQSVQQQLVTLLQRQFNPQAVFQYPAVERLQHRLRSQSEQPVTIRQAGALLQVHGMFDVIHLVGAEQGRRLFSDQDVQSAFALWGLALQSASVLDAVQQGEHIERRRIAADLHDNIGGRLLHLTTAQGRYGQRAQDTLEDLRTLTRTMGGEPIQLGELLADVRFASVSQCEELDIDYRLYLEIDTDSPVTERSQLPAVLVSSWLSIHSELLRNALNHSNARCIHCALHFGVRRVVFSFRDDGSNSAAPAHWQAGFGLPAIRRRVHQLGGSVQWSVGAFSALSHSSQNGALQNGTQHSMQGNRSVGSAAGTVCTIEWPVHVWMMDGF